MDTLLHSDSSSRRSGLRPFLISLVLHAIFLALAVVTPLIYYRELIVPEVLAVEQLPRLAQPKVMWLQPPSRLKSAATSLRKGVAITVGVPQTIPHGIPDPGEKEAYMTTGVVSSTGILGAPEGEPLGSLFATLDPEDQRRRLAPPRPKPVPKQVPVPVKVSSGVLGAKILDKVIPIYPPLAARIRVQGDVVLEVRVDETGHVREVTVLDGHPLLREAAVTAVRQWTYSPTLLNGQPLEILGLVTVQFRLRN
jgi:protein TonB